MSNKVKYVLIVLLSIIMVISIKFGEIDETYYSDLEVERLYRSIEEVISEVEYKCNVEGVRGYELQEEINTGREKTEEAAEYLKTKENIKLEEVVPKWSIRLDTVQQIILMDIHSQVEVAIAVKSVASIEKARQAMPSNMPEKFKVNFENALDNIEPLTGLSDTMYALAEKAYTSVLKVLKEEGLELNIVQENINLAKEDLFNLKKQIELEYVEEYNNIIGSWSQSIDIVQQKVLNSIDAVISKAEKSKSKSDIENAKKIIPKALPEEWQKVFEARINKL